MDGEPWLQGDAVAADGFDVHRGRGRARRVRAVPSCGRTQGARLSQHADPPAAFRTFLRRRGCGREAPCRRRRDRGCEGRSAGPQGRHAPRPERHRVPGDAAREAGGLRRSEEGLGYRGVRGVQARDVRQRGAEPLRVEGGRAAAHLPVRPRQERIFRPCLRQLPGPPRIGAELRLLARRQAHRNPAGAGRAQRTRRRPERRRDPGYRGRRVLEPARAVPGGGRLLRPAGRQL